MLDVVALGELLIDFAAKSKEPRRLPHYGGQPRRRARKFSRGAERLRQEDCVSRKVGADTFGHLLLGTLKRPESRQRGVIVDPDYFTTLAFVTFDRAGDRSFSFARKPGADTQLRWGRGP